MPPLVDVAPVIAPPPVQAPERKMGIQASSLNNVLMGIF